ncbi:hypothetical protein TWF225_001176 [Orbilia oligospora]|nr:hypothetical protein TWF225_001176 [Orbilia oligospora]KAF3239745.1 hypothetical protein TWF217_001182 [Orbilia oligospora]KAF3282979.1 hypothetical protein TWF132_010499 [Orbilia oligospora]
MLLHSRIALASRRGAGRICLGIPAPRKQPNLESFTPQGFRVSLVGARMPKPVLLSNVFLPQLGNRDWHPRNDQPCEPWEVVGLDAMDIRFSGSIVRCFSRSQSRIGSPHSRIIGLAKHRQPRPLTSLQGTCVGHSRNRPGIFPISKGFSCPIKEIPAFG